MTDLVEIKGASGQYLVPRSVLLNWAYFRAQLTWNSTESAPGFLYLPFPASSLDHLVGWLLHGSNWVLPSDENVSLAFRYCGIDVVEETTEEVKLIPFKWNALEFSFDGSKQTLVSLITPPTQSLHLVVDRDERHILIHGTSTFYTAFRIMEGGRCQLDPRCLEIINQPGIISLKIDYFSGSGDAEITLRNK